MGIIEPPNGSSAPMRAGFLANGRSEAMDRIERVLRDTIALVHTSRRGRETPAGGVLYRIDAEDVEYLIVARPKSGEPHLSPRELEITRLVAEGLPNKCIGGVLEISSWTVATHLRRVFAKLGVTSRAAMIAKIADASAGFGSDMAQGNPAAMERIAIPAPQQSLNSHPQRIGRSPEIAPSATKLKR